MTADNTLLARVLSSEVKAALLMLFHKNPSLADSVEGLARRIGQTPEAILDDLKDLLNLGILKKKRLDDSDVILLDAARDSEIQRIIANEFKRHASDLTAQTVTRQK